MSAHQFLLSPGEWLGTGSIKFTASPDTLRYHTRWEIGEPEGSTTSIKQTVEIEGVGEHVVNQYTITCQDGDGFTMELQNESIGHVKGQGIIDPKTLSWEFRETDSFQGFEIYEKQEDDSYLVKAEFSSADESRTLIEGKLWLRAAQ